MPNQEQAREYGHYHSVVFQKSIQKCLSLILRRDQTTWPIQRIKRYLLKDYVHIFHLAPRDLKLAHLL